MTENDVTLKGGCLCGAIRYQISGSPHFVSQCSCKDCQEATGTGHHRRRCSRDQLAVTGAPQSIIDFNSALSWDRLDPALPHFDALPDSTGR